MTAYYSSSSVFMTNETP